MEVVHQVGELAIACVAKGSPRVGDRGDRDVAFALVRPGLDGTIAFRECDCAAARRRPQHDLAAFGAPAGLPGGSSGVSLASTSMLLARCDTLAGDSFGVLVPI
jgi:hypothetical protein